MNSIIDQLQKSPIKNLPNLLSTFSKQQLSLLKSHLDDLYYNTSESTLDDNRYDILKEYLGDTKVGSILREGLNRTKLPYWLGSANKVAENSKALSSWIGKHKPPYLITLLIYIQEVMELLEQIFPISLLTLIYPTSKRISPLEVN
jgi:hypothetical protein